MLFRNEFKDLKISKLLLILIGVLLFFFVQFDIIKVYGISMQESLQPGDRVVVMKIQPFRITKNVSTNKNNISEITNFQRLFRFFSINRNDILIFSLPIGEKGIKRCVGLPEDSIEFINNKIYVNDCLFGIARIDSSSLHPTIQFINIKSTKSAFFSCSSSQYFLLGDNRSYSIDSRHFGPISDENIFGKAIFVLFNYHNGRFSRNRFLKKIR